MALNKKPFYQHQLKTDEYSEYVVNDFLDDFNYRMNRLQNICGGCVDGFLLEPVNFDQGSAFLIFR